jgi:hypothetical protein
MNDESRKYGAEGLTLPHDVVSLPTQGIFYKNKKKSIKVGYLTASDENILLSGSNDITLNLLRSKIYEPDLKVDDLMESDVEAILIFLRNTSFGPEVNLKLTDPATKKEFEISVRIDELNILKGEDPQQDGTYTAKLPKSNVTVVLKPLNYGQTLELEKQIDAYPKGIVAPRVTLRLQREILEIDGNSDKAFIAKFVEQMPIADSKFIRKYLEDNVPKLDMRRVVNAPSGEKLTVNVGFGVDFFRPFFGL